MLLKNTGQSSEIKWRVIGLFGKLFIDLVFAGSKIEIKGKSAVAPILSSNRFILAFWHSRILLVSYLHKGWNARIMVSNSADGEIIARILHRQGHHAIRGSTSKGGLRALRHLASEIRQHPSPAGIVPDGPQGPRQKAQPGAVFLSRLTGYPIIPVTYSAKHMKVFNSWDQFLLPFPLSPCVLQYGNPIFIPSESDTNHLELWRLLLEKELNHITWQSDTYFGHRF